MASRLESCAVYGGAKLPSVLLAPGDVGYADLYWRNVQTEIVEAGQALTIRGQQWLIEGVALWLGRPGGIHAKVRLCDTQGLLYRRTATVTAYGVTHTDAADGIPFVGVLGVALSDEDGGRIAASADLTPAAGWTGTAGDLIVMSDGTRWEQQGDVTERTTAGGTWAGRKSRLPVVHIRRVRDGSSVNE